MAGRRARGCRHGQVLFMGPEVDYTGADGEWYRCLSCAADGYMRGGAIEWENPETSSTLPREARHAR